MATVEHDYPAAARLPLRKFVVNGVEFIPGILDDDDVETVLRYVVEQWAARVEPLVSPGCWGFSFRPNKNNPSEISKHGRAIALDINAPQHPNGVPTVRTFTRAEIAVLDQILAEVDDVVAWGGEWSNPDGMHVEIDDDRAAVARVANRLREEDEDMKPEDIDKLSDAVVEKLMRHKPKGSTLAVETLLKQAANAAGLVRALARALGKPIK